MVRAIFIDPVERNVSVARVPDVWHDIRMKYGAKLVRVAVMPCGDAVYVAEENKDSIEAFRLGCSAVFGGWGLLLGRKGQFGLVTDVLTDRDDVATLTEFRRR
jgi:hypothetical protein